MLQKHIFNYICTQKFWNTETLEFIKNFKTITSLKYENYQPNASQLENMLKCIEISAVKQFNERFD